MNKKLKLGLHLLAQVLGLSAVAILVTPHYKPLFDAAVAVVGVTVAFFDNQVPQQ